MISRDVGHVRARNLQALCGLDFAPITARSTIFVRVKPNSRSDPSRSGEPTICPFRRVGLPFSQAPGPRSLSEMMTGVGPRVPLLADPQFHFQGATCYPTTVLACASARVATSAV